MDAPRLKATWVAVANSAVLLLALGVWVWIVMPVVSLDARSMKAHAGHDVPVIFHAATGTIPLLLGPLLLASGFARWRPRWHRWAGRTYIVVGAAGATLGAMLSILAAHPPYSLNVATFTLAVAWLLATLMAWRAIRHRRIEQHRDWVIRSYVLTFTFVVCRLAMRASWFEALGAEGVTATIWASWIFPLLIAEVALQWRRTGPPQGHRTS